MAAGAVQDFFHGGKGGLSAKAGGAVASRCPLLALARVGGFIPAEDVRRCPDGDTRAVSLSPQAQVLKRGRLPPRPTLRAPAREGGMSGGAAEQTPRVYNMGGHRYILPFNH